MPYNEDHYKMNDKGYETEEELKRAYENGHLERLSNSYYDRQTGEEFWPDGTKKN